MKKNILLASVLVTMLISIVMPSYAAERARSETSRSGTNGGWSGISAAGSVASSHSASAASRDFSGMSETDHASLDVAPISVEDSIESGLIDS